MNRRVEQIRARPTMTWGVYEWDDKAKREVLVSEHKTRQAAEEAR